MGRPNPRFHYKQTSTRYLKRLRQLLSCLPKAHGLEAFWVLDRARIDKDFRKPFEYQYPNEFLFANIGEPSAVYGWELETLITELLACPQSNGRRTLNSKDWSAIAALVNALRSVGNAEAGLHDPSLIWRSMSRALLRQIPWQIHYWNEADSVRWWSIFQSDLLKTIFRERVGVSLSKFIRMGMAWNQILNEVPFRSYPSADREFGVTATEIASFASAISGSIAEISAASREIVREFSEIDFRRSALRQKPVVIVGNQYIRPIEQLLTWRITSGLYYDVIGDSRSANEIGSQYEKYTRELFRAFVKNRKVDGDFRYGTRQRSQRAPDCIVHDNGAVQVIVECKAKKLPLVAQTAMIETRERAIAVGEIANGVAQVRLFRQALLNGVVPDFHLAESATLIVVTLDDWVFVGADIKDDIFKQAREISLAKGLNAETIGDCDVVLCTAAELDRLTSRYSYDTLRLICDRNLEEKYKNYPLTGVANECFKEKRHQAEYPLQAKLDKLIGIGVDEQGQEFLLDDAGEKCSPY